MQKGDDYKFRVDKDKWLEWWFEDYDLTKEAKEELRWKKDFNITLDEIFFNWPGYLPLKLIHPDDHQEFLAIHDYQLETNYCHGPDENEIYIQSKGNNIEIKDDYYYIVSGTINY